MIDAKALEGKVAIVTGSSRGIGRAIALGFAREGARVVVAGRSSDPNAAALSIEGTKREIEEAGGEALAIRCDITQEGDVRNLVQQVIDRWGRIDVLVNNAGITWAFGLLETPPEKWNEIMRTNVDGLYVDGLYLCSIVAAPHMIAAGGGSVINISSGRGRSEDARSVAYAASKAAVTRLSIKFAAEMKPHNVAVNVLDPGATLVERASTGSDRSGWKRPEEKKIIPACVYLARQRGDGFTGHEVSEAEFEVSWP